MCLDSQLQKHRSQHSFRTFSLFTKYFKNCVSQTFIHVITILFVLEPRMSMILSLLMYPEHFTSLYS